VAVNASPGAGRVLIATGAGPLVAEPTWTRFDDTALCRCAGFDWERGRQSEFDVTNTGTARVRFHDRNGTFATAEDFVGLQIMLQLYDPCAEAWEPVFRGHIDSILSSPNTNTDAVTDVELDCVDIFDYLGGAKLVVGVMGDALPTGMSGVVFYEDGPVDDRITAALDDGGLDSTMYVVFSGNIDVNETLYDPDDVILQVVREASDAEFPSGVANAYADRYGRVVWHGRFAKFDPDAVSGDAGDDAWNFQRWEAATRADVGTTRAQIREYEDSVPRSRIINSYLAWPAEDEKGVEFKQSNVAALVRTDSGSIASQGYHGEEAANLIIKEHKTNGNTGAVECGLFGDYYVANYADPQKTVERITFKSLRANDPRAAATWAFMTRADIADAVDLYIAERGLSGEEFFIEGISGECEVGKVVDIVTVTPNLSPAAYFATDVFS
jgi:hypothetical protein